MVVDVFDVFIFMHHNQVFALLFLFSGILFSFLFHFVLSCADTHTRTSREEGIPYYIEKNTAKVKQSISPKLKVKQLLICMRSKQSSVYKHLKIKR